MALILGLSLGFAGCATRARPTHAAVTGSALPPGIAKQVNTFAARWIQNQPGDLLVTNTGSAQFSIVVTGPARFLSYQWFFNGQPIPNATNLTHTIPVATTNHIGLYTCRVTFDKPGKSGSNPHQPDEDFGPPQSEMSEPGTLSLYWKGSVIVCGAPVLGSGGAGTSCPGPYVGYVNFKTTTGGGFTPLGTTFSARDPQSTTANPTSIRWFDSQLRSKCSGGGTITNTAASTSLTYKFTVYFPVSSYLSYSSYQLTLENFRAP